MSTKSAQFVFRDVKYESLQSFMMAHNLNKDEFILRLRNKQPLGAILDEMQAENNTRGKVVDESVIVVGIKYKSLETACEMLGADLSQIQTRLDYSISIDMAFTNYFESERPQIYGTEYLSYVELAKEHGLTNKELLSARCRSSSYLLALNNLGKIKLDYSSNAVANSITKSKPLVTPVTELTNKAPDNAIPVAFEQPTGSRISSDIFAND